MPFGPALALAFWGSYLAAACVMLAPRRSAVFAVVLLICACMPRVPCSAAALETLKRDLGIERIMLEGGGGANGALLRAGLIDELSLVICPVIDGSTGGPIVFRLCMKCTV